MICEIETDKATMEVEAVDEGKIGKIVVPEGTEGVKVNAVIAILLEEGETAVPAGAAACAGRRAESRSSAGSGSAQAGSGRTCACSRRAAPAPAAPAPAAQPAAAPSGERIFASPLAKRIAADKGLDLSRITGSGPNGRIVKADVETAKPGAAPAAAPVAAGAPRPRRRPPDSRCSSRRATRACRTPPCARSSRGACSSPSRPCRTST